VIAKSGSGYVWVVGNLPDPTHEVVEDLETRWCGADQKEDRSERGFVRNALTTMSFRLDKKWMHQPLR
jgi:hypothetical protein